MGDRSPMSETWAPVPEGSDFPLENLPFGVFRPRDEEPRVGVRIGDHVVDLVVAGIDLDLTARPSLNLLMASGRGGALRDRVAELLIGPERPDVLGADRRSLRADARRTRRLHRLLLVDPPRHEHGSDDAPGRRAAAANWRQLPVAYHGRARTVVPSGTPVVRPEGLIPDGDGPAKLAPTRALDIELEVGFLVGGPPASRIEPDHADRHLFGVVLLERLVGARHSGLREPAARPAPGEELRDDDLAVGRDRRCAAAVLRRATRTGSPPDPYLRAALPWGLDLNLAVELNGEQIAATNFRQMYWTFAQQLAHLTVNGAPAGAGDLFASGTASGPTPGERGSLIELTWRGAEPLTLADGSTRTFLEDDDTVTLRGWCGGDDQPRIGFGEATGTIVATPERE